MTGRQHSFPGYLALALAAAASAAALYVALFFFQLGPYMPADYWIRDAFVLKEHLADQVAGEPRILIMAGSGSLYGIDSSLIEKETGRPTVNLAINGGLGLDFIAKQTLRVAGPGDVVLAPLEPSFIQLPMIPQWFYNNIMAWGDWYFDSLSTWGKTKFLFSVNPLRVVDGALSRCLDQRVPEEIRRVRTRQPDEIIGFMEHAWDTGTMPDDPDLPYSRLSRHGDLRYGDELERGFKTYDKGYLSGDARVRTEFVRLYTAFRAELEERNARLILFWPATMADETFDLSREPDRKVVEAFRDNLHRNGIRIVGSPVDAQYPRELFFDTNFHLGPEGRELNTRRIVDLLRVEAPDLFTGADRTQPTPALEEPLQVAHHTMPIHPQELSP